MLKKSLWFSAIISAGMLTGLSACSPPTPQTDSNQIDSDTDNSEAHSAITIDGDTVNLSTSHIFNIKSKRYQPSLGFTGSIIPINITTLTSPTNAIIRSTSVTQDQPVTKGSPLLTLLVVDTETTAQTKNQPAQINAVNNPENVRAKATNNTQTTQDTNISNSSASPSETSAPKTNQNQALSKTNAITAAIDSVTETVSDTTTKLTQEAKGTEESLAPTQAEIDRTDIDAASNTPPQPSHDSVNGRSGAPYSVGQILTFKAPFAGQVDQLYVKSGTRVNANQPLLKLSDPTDLQFIGTLPITTKSQLSVGQSVTFTVAGSNKTLTGQVSQLKPAQNPAHLLVYVHVLANNDSRSLLKPGMSVAGRIDYGQIQVGTIVPKAGIQEADVSALTSPPYRAQVPIKAHVWIIGQDQRLIWQPVEVIEYDPTTNQYLVAGISNDSLICLAPLPKASIGKKVVVS